MAQNDESKLDFLTFVMTLAMTGMQQLGAVPHPETGAVSMDLSHASQTIELLRILEEKTKGNLTKEEADYLRSALTNLRLNYAEAVNTESAKRKA